MRLRTAPPALLLALLTGLTLSQAGRAEAARFSVSPTQVVLSARVASAMLSLRNESTEALRFQLSASAWDQAPNGEMKLQDTEDVVFFPQLLTLGPGEERKVRVAVTRGAALVETSYRLFVEELPPADQSPTPGVVRVLTKMGIPIFVQPARLQLNAELRDAGVAGSRLQFTIANVGNVHFVPEDLVLRALSPEGRTVGERRVDAWYILPGGIRRFSVDLAGIASAPVAEWLVECRAGNAVLSRRVAEPRRAPRP